MTSLDTALLAMVICLAVVTVGGTIAIVSEDRSATKVFLEIFGCEPKSIRRSLGQAAVYDALKNLEEEQTRTSREAEKLAIPLSEKGLSADEYASASKKHSKAAKSAGGRARRAQARLEKARKVGKRFDYSVEVPGGWQNSDSPNNQ